MARDANTAQPSDDLGSSGALTGTDTEESVPHQQVVVLDIGLLALDGSPRLAGENKAHTRVLAEAGAKLPPVLVHRPTMRVIDGVHRLQAAKLRGESTVDAIYFDGNADAAFVLAVKANIAHGLPLTLADRRAAAERLLSTHGDWSDRAVAAVTGLAATTIRTIRHRVTDRSAQLHTRVGRDGKRRPLDHAEGRRRAAKAIAERPSASLREIANAARISTRTVRDVRKRVQDGGDPVPTNTRTANAAGDALEKVSTSPSETRAQNQRTQRTNGRSPSSVLESLKRDPSLRYSEKGRAVIRWLHAHFVDPSDESLVADLPPHCAHTIAELALGYADTWKKIATNLQSLAESLPAPSAK